MLMILPCAPLLAYSYQRLQLSTSFLLCAADMEEVPGRGADVEEVPGRGPDLEEVLGRGPDLEEVPGRGPDLNEVPGRGPDLEEVSGRGADVEEVPARGGAAEDLFADPGCSWHRGAASSFCGWPGSIGLFPTISIGRAWSCVWTHFLAWRQGPEHSLGRLVLLWHQQTSRFAGEISEIAGEAFAVVCKAFTD